MAACLLPGVYRVNAPLLVLMYHRVNCLRPDPWDLCVTPKHFAEHLDIMQTLPLAPVITFDDGYADNFENARPLLEKYAMPATVFVTSGSVGSPCEMWWDELDRRHLQAAPPDWEAYEAAFERARRGEANTFPARPVARPERRMMTRQQVAELAAGGLIAIGAHTVTHPVLSSLAVERQRWEIVQSKRDLEEITGAPVTQFAYPNGFKADYTAETVSIVRDSGFTCAYAAWDAPLHEPFQPYEIPRMMVRDWDGDAFAGQVRAKLLQSGLL